MAMWNLERNLQDPERYANDLNLQKLYIHKIIKLAGAEEKLNEYTTELVNFMTEITQVKSVPVHLSAIQLIRQHRLIVTLRYFRSTDNG